MGDLHPVKAALLIGAGGSVGALSRYYVTVGVTRLMGGGWPFGTFAVNLVGCLVLGYLSALAARELLHPVLRPLVMVGFLGAFTTFSTFGYETVKLWRESDSVWMGTSYVLVRVLLGIAAAWAGFRLGIVGPTEASP